MKHYAIYINVGIRFYNVGVSVGKPSETLKFQRLNVDWQSRGQGFEPPMLHQRKTLKYQCFQRFEGFVFFGKYPKTVKIIKKSGLCGLCDVGVSVGKPRVFCRKIYQNILWPISWNRMMCVYNIFLWF